MLQSALSNVEASIMMLMIFGAMALVFVLAERLFPVRSQQIVRRGFFTDLLYVPLHYLMRTVINGMVAVGLSHSVRRLVPDHTIDLLRDQPLWVQALTLLLVLDFFFYVMHRLKHRWRWWWRLHETHHSSMDLDWLSSARFHPLEKILDRTIYLLPLLVVGVSDGALLIWASVDAFFGMFIHSNLRWRIGPFIYLFVGPEMHRWHHVRDPRRRDCNFGNNFSIFDWVFGTAYITSDEPSEFGVDDPAFPEGNMLKQFLYAFRPFSSDQLVRSERQAVEISPVQSVP